MTDQHTPLTAEQLADIEARVAAAAPGPWRLCDDYSDVLTPDGYQLASYAATADGGFIAHARTDVPALLAEIARLKGQRKFLIAQLAKRDAESGRGDAALREFLAGEEQPTDSPAAAAVSGAADSRHA